MELFHQQHLSSPFNGTVQLALVMRGQSRVFPRENAPLVGHELLEQVDVLEIESVEREINFRLGARRPCFRSGCLTASVTPCRFVLVSFSWHKKLLFDFAMHCMTTKSRIELLNLQLFGLKFFVSGRGVARRRFALFARFRAFNCNDFSGHKLFFVFNRLFFAFVVFVNFNSASAVHRTQRTQTTLPQRTVFFQL